MATQSYTDGVTLTAAAEFNNFDSVAYSVLSSVSGTNTITATGPANYTYSATRPPIWFIPANTNTGATTINVTPSGGSALGAKNIFSGGSALVAGELVANVPAAVIYDGTQFNLMSPAVTVGTTSSTFTFNGSGGTSGAVTLTWQKVGRFVTLNIPAVSATTGTNSTTFTSDTALATAVRPTSSQDCVIMQIRNNAGAVAGAGLARIGTNGIVTILRDGAASTFTDASSSGLNTNASITYYVG